MISYLVAEIVFYLNFINSLSHDSEQKDANKLKTSYYKRYL